MNDEQQFQPGGQPPHDDGVQPELPFGPVYGEAVPLPQVHAAKHRRHRRRPVALALAVLALGGAGATAVVDGVGRSSTLTAQVTTQPARSIQSAQRSTGTQVSTTGSDASTVASSVAGGIVDIVTTLSYQSASAAGTGMVLTSTGEILTNNHVVDGATSIKVTVVSTGRTYTASVVGTDPTQDVAVIQLKGASGLKTIPVGSSAAVAVGQKVTASGNAGGKGGTPSVVTGTVTALAQSITATDQGGGNAERLTGLIQTDADIVPGDSGGPLAAAGKVIGMDTAASSDNSYNTAASQGYAIPIQTALTIANQIEAGQASSTIHLGVHGFLGIALQSDTTGSNGFGAPNGSPDTATTPGATLSDVTPSGAAAAAGLQAGDTITAVNATTVSSASALTSVMASTKPGQTVTLTWTDSSGQTHTAHATLGAAPAD